MFSQVLANSNSRGIEGNGFADDCCALIGGSNLKEMTITLQAMADELTVWGRTCGLHFNASKTVSVLFTRKGCITEHFLKIDGKIVDYSDSVKYLGVDLDNRLHWREHISKKIDKAKSYLLKVANLTRKKC